MGPSRPHPERYSIGKLAKLTGTKAETVRYYESTGLMPAPPRTEGGHRAYSEDHRKRLLFIRRCRDLGFSMHQIEGLLAMVDSHSATCAEVAEKAEHHLQSIRQRIADLQALEQTLSETLSQCHRGDTPDCAILDVLSASDRPF